MYGKFGAQRDCTLGMNMPVDRPILAHICTHRGGCGAPPSAGSFVVVDPAANFTTRHVSIGAGPGRQHS